MVQKKRSKTLNVISFLEVNPEQIEIDIGLKEAILVDKREGLDSLTRFDEEAVVSRQAAISLRSHLAQSIEQIK